MAPGCPAEDRLAALLDEALSPEEFREVEAHVADCAACQATLERLNAFTWREWRLLGTGDGDATPPLGPIPEIPGHEIQEEIGRGGHGVVFRAVDGRLDRVVALKMIRHGALAGDAERRRFLTEARAAARINYPHIIPIYAVGEYAGQPYYTMELVAGGGLDRRLAAGSIGVGEAARLVERLARALQHAHERGVIHRDLKPANILLADETLEEPRVADFGIARIADAQTGRTPSGAPFGTPGYMAPEQAVGRPNLVDARADVFALGAVLYETLVGRPPFRGDTTFETLLHTREREPTPPSALRATVPRPLEAICLKCLSKRPDDRYQTAADLADDLRRFIDGETVQAVEQPKPAPRRAVRRPGRWVAIAAALGLGLGSAWMALRDSRVEVAPPDDVVQLLRATDPSEVPSLQAAFDSGPSVDLDHLQRLLGELLSLRDPGALAAAAVLAESAPDDARWASRALSLAGLLFEADEPARSAWLDQLRPLAAPLAGALVDRLADGVKDPAERSPAARLLLDLSARDAEAASLLEARLADLAAPHPEATVVERAERAGNLGAALILAGDDRFTEPLLRKSPAPTARAHLIVSLGANVGEQRERLLDRVGSEPDAGVRQALLLALGRAKAPPSNDVWDGREAADREVLRLYRDDPDPGVHSAAEYVLLRWGMLSHMRAERNVLADARPPGAFAEDLGWLVGPRRHTMAVARPPGERPFAIATCETSALQLKEFFQAIGAPPPPGMVRDGFPALPVPLSVARHYCNWLSLQDGLSDQLCYEPGPNGLLEPVADFLDRRGYRLPTEREWLFAYRGEAAATTPYPYGHGDELFHAYGRASASEPRNVSRFMPNDHGLFDMLGNASEWCECPETASAVARGGCFLLPPSAAPTFRIDPATDHETGRTVGFRVARTWP